MNPLPRSHISRALLRWYSRERRSLPWRRSRDAYHILVSEVMLQQTQVSRVAEIYPVFLRRFPTLAHLAAASPADVIRAWQGMGYNTRAVRLHRLAVSVKSHRGGRLPSSVRELERLPGLGPYSARAVACFAFGRRVAVVETNIRRVLQRWIGRPLTARRLQSLAEELLPRTRVADWNQALMDLGATICRQQPLCDACPVSRYCRSAFRAEERPRKNPQRLRHEPSRDGIPRRIYRGRVVELFRRMRRGRFIAVRALGPGIKDPFRADDVRWLEELVRGLEHDGLLKLRTRGGTLEAKLAD